MNKDRNKRVFMTAEAYEEAKAVFNELSQESELTPRRRRLLEAFGMLLHAAEGQVLHPDQVLNFELGEVARIDILNGVTTGPVPPVNSQDSQPRTDFVATGRPDRGGPDDPDPMIHSTRRADEDEFQYFLRAMAEIHRQRDLKYADTQTGHAHLGQIWTAMLEQYFGQPLPRPVDARMVFLLFAASKLNRAAVDGKDLDHCLDGAHYFELSWEAANARASKTD